jgi:predicted small secreted protein
MMRRILATVAILVCALTLAAGCGGSGGSGGSAGSGTKTIDVTFSGDSVTPNGDRIQVSVGQPVELVVKADEPGEIHVHSTPEQELAYDAGTTHLTLKPIDKPGIIEVESHALEKTIVQLEVR